MRGFVAHLTAAQLRPSLEWNVKRGRFVAGYRRSGGNISGQF